jgi:hypothetical protein
LCSSQSEWNDSVGVGAGVFTRLVRFVETVLEFFLCFTQVLRKLGKLRTAKEHENKNEKNDALWATERKSDHEFRLPHRRIDGVAPSTRPSQVLDVEPSWASKMSAHAPMMLRATWAR